MTITVEFFNNKRDNEFDSGTHIVEFNNCEYEISGDFIILKENKGDETFSHVFPLNEVKVFKYGNK
jgi:hypothetical protein